MYGKLLEALKEAAPNVTRVAVVMNPEQVPQTGMLRAIEAAAPALAVRVSNLSIRDPIERSFASFAQERNGGLIALPNPVADGPCELIAKTAARHGLPAIYAYRYYVAAGGLIAPMASTPSTISNRRRLMSTASSKAPGPPTSQCSSRPNSSW